MNVDSASLCTPFGVYLIGNAVNAKLYAGKTVKGFTHRWKTHLAHVRCGSTYKFHRAIRKHGPENFRLAGWLGLGKEFLERHVLDADTEALKLEEKVIARLDLTNPSRGYNLTGGGEGASPTKEVRARIGAALKGRIFSEESRAKMSAAQKGKAPSAAQRAAHLAAMSRPEVRAKLSIVAKARVTPETRAKLRAVQTGKIASEETRAKMRASHIGKPGPPPRVKGAKMPAGVGQNISAALKGKPKSPEHRAKLSAARKGKHFPALSAAQRGKVPWNKGRRTSRPASAFVQASLF